MLTARDMIEPSTRKRSKSKGSKSEKARATDETPEEKEARREERRMKKVERQARQEVEALALLGLPRMRRHKVGKEKKKGESKGKEILVEPPTPKESKSEKKTKVSVKEVISNGFPAKKPIVSVKRTGSPKREVRSKHLARGAHSRDTSLNNVKDSSAKPRQHGQEHRHHRHHEHSSPESELSCGRCVKRARKRAQEAAEAAGKADLAERLERPEREGETAAAAAARNLRRRARQAVQSEGAGVQAAAAPVEVPRTERRSRSRTVNSRAASLPRPVVVTQRDPRQAELMRARDIQRAQAAAAAVRQMAVPAVPALVRSNSERAPARQAEAVPARQQPARQQAARQPARQPVRTAERTAQRHVERPQPQPPPAPARSAERTARERGSERMEMRPARRQHMRTQSEQRDRTRQVEVVPAVRRRSLRGPVPPAPVVRAPQPQPQPQPQAQPERPILEFELGTKPQKLIVCVTCMDDETPSTEAAKLACGHWFCNECLKRLFILSLTDPAHMPPKCCTSDHIPLRHAQNLLSYQNKKLWNTKYLEFTTVNRIYCPSTNCGEWIPPKYIRDDVGHCQKCGFMVCVTCSGRAHGGEDCPQDPEMLKFFETAEKHKFQKCYSCKAMVELERGCNHMTCHCTAQFCYVCGSKWKSCDCAWFNYQPGEAEREDRLRAENAIRRLGHGRVAGPAGADLARALDDIPAADPFAALGALGLGLRNGIRRLAAGNAEPIERPAAPDRRRTDPLPPVAGPAGPARQDDRELMRQNMRGLLNTGPGLGLGLARVNGAAAFYGAAAAGRPAPPQAAPVNAQAPPPRLAAPRSNFLTASQQAHVERYIADVDLEDAEPAVESPFQQAAGTDDEEPAAVVPNQTPMRRSNTERAAPRPTEYVRPPRSSSATRKSSDVGGSGRAGFGLSGIGLSTLDTTGVRQLVGGSDARVSRTSGSRRAGSDFSQRRP